jgi:ubiquinone/menaquinone biosynthesis C-methylase UbiE
MVNQFNYAGSELDLFASVHHWKAYLLKMLAPYIRGHILEVGAGIGTNTKLFSHLDWKSWTCLEPDASLVHEVTNKTSLFQNKSYTVITGTIESIPADQHFDTVLYLDVLEHIEEDRQQLEKCRMMLQPGGRIVVLAPAHQWLFSHFDKSIGHFRRYNKQTLSELCPKDMKVLGTSYLDTVGMLASAANRFLLKKDLPKPSQLQFWDRVMVPLSKVIDPILKYRFGKTILAVYELN